MPTLQAAPTVVEPARARRSLSARSVWPRPPAPPSCRCSAYLRRRTGLAQLVAVLERYLAAFPDQWFAFYDVWGARGSA